MSNEELIREYKAGNMAALQDLYFSNKGLMHQAYKRYGAGLEAEDVLQECFFAVATAADLYNADMGSFANYLMYWLKACIIRYRDESGGVIRVPGYQRDRIRKYKRTIADYQKQNGRDPTGRELAALLDLTADQLEQVRKDALALEAVSTSQPVGEDEGSVLEDLLPAEGDGIGDLLDRMEAQQLKKTLWEVVDTLPGNKAAVIRSRYQEGQSLRECGDKLHCSAEYVRQIELSALADLRHGQRAARLRPWTIYNEGLKGTGLQAFRRSGSVQERILIRHEEREEYHRRLQERIALFRAGKDL